MRWHMDCVDFISDMLWVPFRLVIFGSVCYGYFGVVSHHVKYKTTYYYNGCIFSF